MRSGVEKKKTTLLRDCQRARRGSGKQTRPDEGEPSEPPSLQLVPTDNAENRTDWKPNPAEAVELITALERCVEGATP